MLLQRQQLERPQLYEDLDDADRLLQSPGEQWPSGLPPPWLGDAIYQLPLDNNMEWVHQQQQQQQQQQPNQFRFSGSSSNSEESKKDRRCRTSADASASASASAKRHGAKNGRKKRKSDNEPNKVVRPTTLMDGVGVGVGIGVGVGDGVGDGIDEIHRQPIYMEVEDSGYTEDSSSTPSSGSNTHNLASAIKNVESNQTSVMTFTENNPE